MSNSAAGRIASPSAIDAPDTIAINRLALGWLDQTDVFTASTKRTTTTSLKPSTGASGTRLVVVPVDSTRVVTIELVVNDGYNKHLPSAGIAVHIVDTSQGTTTSRFQQTVEIGLRSGQTLTTSGWTIVVESVDTNEAVVTVERA